MKYITAKQALTPNGWRSDLQIGIGPDGKINYLGPEKSKTSHEISLILPAPVNLHSHTFQRAMAGLTEARGPDPKDSFWTWRNLLYRFLDRLGPDQVEAIATLAFMEMVEAGYCGVAEFHYLHHAPNGRPYSNLSELCQRIITAANTIGIGLTLLPVLYQYGGCDRRPLQGGQRRFGCDIDQFSRLVEGAKSELSASPADFGFGIAPHSLRAVDNEGLHAATNLCPTGPIHIHLAEQKAEVEEVRAHLHARPAEWLLDNHKVDENWCLIHCTQMNSAETLKVAKSNAVVGLCPITESNLGDGIFNGTKYLDAGGTIGVGSDSNIHISLFEELKTLEYSQRLRDRSRAALANENRSTGRVLFEEVLIGGARAANRNSGAIEIGMFADLIGIDTDNQWLCNRQGDGVLDSLIFNGHGQSCITDVWSAGRHVVKKGHHRQRNAIIQNFKQTIAELGNDF